MTIQQLALTEAMGKPLVELAREWVLNPIGTTHGDNGSALVDAVHDKIQQAYRWDVLDKPIPRTYGPVVKDGQP